jgi:hypothetical protein
MGREEPPLIVSAMLSASAIDAVQCNRERDRILLARCAACRVKATDRASETGKRYVFPVV